MVVDLPQLVFTYIARKPAKQEWNSKKKKKKTYRLVDGARSVSNINGIEMSTPAWIDLLSSKNTVGGMKKYLQSLC
jgi:hypothetical protein